MSARDTVKAVLSRYWRELRRYADFSGTSDWRSYGSFFAINLLITLFCKAMEGIRDDGFFGMIGLLYGFVVLLPGLAVTVRVLRFALAGLDARRSEGA